MRFRHIVIFAGVVAVCAPGMAVADDVSDLKAQMEVLQKQLDAVKTQLYNMQETKKKEEVSEKQRPFVRLKPDSGLTFEVGQGEIQLYGHADLSVDEVDNGLKGRFGAQGKNGWLLQEASNLSYFGIRGKRRLTPGITGLFQFETEIAYVNTPEPTSDAQIKLLERFYRGAGRRRRIGTGPCHRQGRCRSPWRDDRDLGAGQRCRHVRMRALRQRGRRHSAGRFFGGAGASLAAGRRLAAVTPGSTRIVVRTLEQEAQVSFRRQPFAVEDAEHHRVAAAAIRHQLVIA
jgi:hypothetical protein